MNLRLVRRPAVLASFAVALVTSGKISLANAVEPLGGAPDVLKTGTVTVIGSVSCPANAATGASCKSVNVSCTGLPDLGATLAVAKPSGSARGTIILLSGGPGTDFFNAGFADVYVGDGFNVVQVAWANEWESANGAGVKSAACRPASVFKFAFNTVQQKSTTKGFCGQGTSGGGAALAYSLADYGMSNFFDYIVIAAGPGVARMDYGCDQHLYTGASRDLCPLLTNAPFAYASGVKENRWENTTTCAQPDPLPSDITRWTDDSIVTAGAGFSYPKTAMSWFFCVTPGSVGSDAGQGSFLIDQVVPKNAPPDVNCYSGSCQGEAVWQDPSAFNTTVSEMLAQCVPNH